MCPHICGILQLIGEEDYLDDDLAIGRGGRSGQPPTRKGTSKAHETQEDANIRADKVCKKARKGSKVTEDEVEDLLKVGGRPINWETSGLKAKRSNKDAPVEQKGEDACQRNVPEKAAMAVMRHRSAITNLQERVAQAGCQIMLVKDDGHCLFHALCLQLQGETHQELRCRIVKHLGANWKRLSAPGLDNDLALSHSSKRKFLQKLAQAEWGEQSCLRTAGDLLGHIVVFQGAGDEVLHFGNELAPVAHRLAYDGVQHYDAVFECVPEVVPLSSASSSAAAPVAIDEPRPSVGAVAMAAEVAAPVVPSFSSSSSVAAAILAGMAEPQNMDVDKSQRRLRPLLVATVAGAATSPLTPPSSTGVAVSGLVLEPSAQLPDRLGSVSSAASSASVGQAGLQVQPLVAAKGCGSKKPVQASIENCNSERLFEWLHKRARARAQPQVQMSEIIDILPFALAMGALNMRDAQKSWADSLNRLALAKRVEVTKGKAELSTWIVRFPE